MFKRTLCSLLASLYLTCSPTISTAYDLNDNHFIHKTKDHVEQATAKISFAVKKKDHTGLPMYERRAGTSLFLCDTETKKRYILTADHVLPDRKDKYFVYVDNVSVESYQRHQTDDIALLETSDSKHPCFQGKIASDNHIGDFVFIIGYNDDHKIHYREGKIARKFGDLGFIITSDIFPGDSGGAVIALDFGQPILAGMLLATDRDKQRYAYAISASRICDFLKETPLFNDYCEEKK